LALMTIKTMRPIHVLRVVLLYPVLFNISKVGLKEFTWRAYGRRQFVSGKSKSAMRSLSIIATPR
jgi:hypothetical protein